MNTFYLWNHQGKGDAFERAMCSGGYTRSDVKDARVILTDVDVPARVSSILNQLKSGQSKLFCYPHAARPYIGWDGLYPLSQYTSASFVFADGHIDVIRAYGYKKPLHVVGWLYSKILPFQPTTLRHVLFAPIHPSRSGFLSGLDKGINRKAYSILLSMIESDGITLTVRMVRSAEENGLWNDRRVAFENADLNVTQSWDEIIKPYDLIVSHQTFAYISVALGKPTLMMAEDEAPRTGNSENTFKRVKSWNLYRDLMAYPLDILNTSDPVTLAKKACAGDGDITDWRSRMIGSKTFDENAVINAVRQYQ